MERVTAQNDKMNLWGGDFALVFLVVLAYGVSSVQLFLSLLVQGEALSWQQDNCHNHLVSLLPYGLEYATRILPV